LIIEREEVEDPSLFPPITKKEMSKTRSREEKVEEIINHYMWIVQEMRLVELEDRNSSGKGMKFHKMSKEVELTPEELELMDKGANGLIYNDGVWMDPRVRRSNMMPWNNIPGLLNEYIYNLKCSDGDGALMTEFYTKVMYEDPFFKY